MNLYQLEGNLMQVINLAESADEQDSKLYNDTIDSLQESIASKAVDYGKVILQLKADQKQLKEKIAKDQERLSALNSNLKKLQNTLQQGLEMAGKERIKDLDISIWFQNNPPHVEYTDANEVPEKFINHTTSIASKDVIAAIKAGEDVPGAKLVQTRSIRIK